MGLRGLGKGGDQGAKSHMYVPGPKTQISRLNRERMLLIEIHTARTWTCSLTCASVFQHLLPFLSYPPNRLKRIKANNKQQHSLRRMQIRVRIRTLKSAWNSALPRSKGSSLASTYLSGVRIFWSNLVTNPQRCDYFYFGCSGLQCDCV